MSEIDIDETTGLPRLPEDHFWRIRERGYHSYPESWGDQGWVGQVSVYATEGPGIWSEWRNKVTKGQDYNTDYEYREVVTRKSILSTFRVKNTIKQERSRPSGRDRFVFSSAEWQDERNTVSAKNLVNRCQEVLHAWNESIERNKIYGDYPPKRLGDDD